MPGNLHLDAGMFLPGALYFFGSKTAMSMHRTFSHSLILARILFQSSRIARREEARALGAGISIGMATHVAADVLVWFAPVTLLWPLNFWLPQVATVDLRAGIRPELPDPVPNLPGAAEFGALALDALTLLRLARHFEEDAAFRPRQPRVAIAQWAAFALCTALAFFPGNKTHNIAVYALFIPVCPRLALHATQKMRAILGRPGFAGKG